MRITAVVGNLVCVFMFIGCVGENVIRYPESESSIKQLQELSSSHQTEILLLNGEKHVGERVVLRSDSLCWQDENKIEHCTPVDSTRVITVIDRGRGLGEGLGYGFLCGAGVGSLMTGASQIAYSDEHGEREGKGFSLLYIPSVGIVGAVLGFVSGVTSGSRDKFIILQKKDPLNKQ